MNRIVCSLLALYSLVTVTFTGCGGSEDSSSMSTTAVIKASGLAGGRFFSVWDLFSEAKQPRAGQRVTATLTNITGVADSLLVLTTEDYCGFSAWSAKSQRGGVALSGREYEPFNLATPEDWTSTGTGIRSGCAGGTIIGLEAYFAYMDLAITVSSVAYDVRVAMGTSGVYQAGDVLVKVSGVFNWIDSASTTLTPVTGTRPSSPYQYAAVKDFVPFLDGGNNDGKQTVLDKLSMTVSDATKLIRLDSTISKVVVNVDFSTAVLTVTDTTSAATVAKTLSVQFLDDYSQLLATVTGLTKAEKGTSKDPVPAKGNGAAESTGDSGGSSTSSR